MEQISSTICSSSSFQTHVNVHIPYYGSTLLWISFSAVVMIMAAEVYTKGDKKNSRQYVAHNTLRVNCLGNFHDSISESFCHFAAILLLFSVVYPFKLFFSLVCSVNLSIGKNSTWWCEEFFNINSNKLINHNWWTNLSCEKKERYKFQVENSDDWK